MTRLTVVVALSRPQCLSAIAQCFRAQTHPDKRLWVVENGRAVGACKASGLSVDRVLTSEPHAATARNTALDELRKRGGGWWASWDDDDWYGPHYLAELAALTNEHAAVVKQQHFVEYEGKLYLFDEQYANRRAFKGTGGALAARVEYSLPFRVKRLGEDHQWCADMIHSGIDLWGGSIHHYLHRRHGPGHGHVTGELTILGMLYLHGNRGYLLGRPRLDVVTGQAPMPKKTLLVPDNRSAGVKVAAPA